MTTFILYMKKMYDFFEKLYDKKVDPTGLALFRIFFGLVLLGELIHLTYFRDLIFLPQAMSIHYEFSFWPLLLVWMISICFLIVGLCTRYVVIINYVYSVLIFGTVSSWIYHVDYVYMGIGILLLFTSVSETLSIDSIFKAWKNKLENKPITIKKISVLNYFSFLVIGIGLVYFDSVFIHKIFSPTWIQGLGVWKPTSVPYLTFLDLNWLMNQKYLVMFLSYLTVFLEFIFIFIFWHRKARIPLIVVGGGLHLGILIAFPIPFFALTMLGFYILLIPLHFLKGLNRLYKEFLHKLFNSPIYESDEIEEILAFKKIKLQAIILFSVMILVFQISASYNSSFIHKFIIKKQLENSLIPRVFAKTSSKLNLIGRVFFGIVSHGVFLDYYEHYNHVVAITYIDKNGIENWLPIIDEKGQVGIYNTGRNWIKITYGVMANKVDSSALATGIMRWTEFYANKKHIDLDDAIFKIKVKKIDIPREWQKDFLKKQLNKPWQDIGEVKWKEGKFISNLPDIESI